MMLFFPFQLAQEQETEEASLKKSKEEFISSLKSSIDKEKDQTEKQLRQAMSEDINELKKQLEKEKELESNRIRNDNTSVIERSRKELREELDKVIHIQTRAHITLLWGVYCRNNNYIERLLSVLCIIVGEG